MLVVRVGDLVKDGAISAVTRVFDALWRRRLRRSSILDKIANTNRVLSKRSRPLSGPFQVEPGRGAHIFHSACRAITPVRSPIISMVSVFSTPKRRRRGAGAISFAG